MLNIIHLFSIVAILLLNLAALTSIICHWVQDRHIARVVAVLTLTLFFFFIEHFFGLGKLSWIWPISSVASVYCLIKIHCQQSWLSTDVKNIGIKDNFKFLLKADSAFALGLILVLLWRLCFPDISHNTEQLTDLYFLSNYMSGQQLPPEDQWLAGVSFNFYYAFQHYAAALMGRILDLDIGTTYNLGFSVFFALIIGLGCSIANNFSKSRWAKLLVVSVILIGGNGVTPLTHMLFDRDYPLSEANEALTQHSARMNMWATIRFVGGMEGGMNTPLAAKLFLHDNINNRILNKDANTPEQREQQQMAIQQAIKNKFSNSPVLSVETLGFLFLSGDFHAPLGGTLLLLLALALILPITKNLKAGKDSFHYLSLLGATIPLSYAVNAWVLPLQGLLIATWASVEIGSNLLSQGKIWSNVLWNTLYKQLKQIAWPLMLGAALCTALLAPFLIEFIANSLGVTLKRIPTEYENPSRLWIYFWPHLVLFAMALFEPAWRKITLTLAITLSIIFVFTSVFFFDDILGGIFERFNTVLKWWAWGHALAMAYLVALLMGSRRIWLKAMTTLVAISMISFGFELGIYVINANRSNFGQIQGHHWLTRNKGNHELIRYLKSAPQGIVIENIVQEAYSPQSSYALFSGKPSLLGWPDHVRSWRGNPPIVAAREPIIKQIYRSQIASAQALEWLDHENVRYIIWSPQEETSAQFNFDSVNTLLSPSYQWRSFNEIGTTRIGLWERRE